MKTLIFVLFFCFSAWNASAQMLLPIPSKSTEASMYMHGGLSFTTGIGAGYHRGIENAFGSGFRMAFDGYLWHPLPPHAFPENGEIGGALTVFLRGRFSWMAIRAGAELRQANSALANGASTATRFSVVPFYQGKKHRFGAELGWHHAWAAYLVHRSSYRQQFPEVQDGWYRNTGGHFLFIGQYAYNISKRATINLSAGRRMVENFKDYGLFVIPWTVQTGVQIHI
jgi:hypothetical protein